MKIRLFITLLLIASFSFLQMDCKKEEQIIPPENIPTLGKRDYTWTIDTIKYPGTSQLIMNSISGSSSNDIYIVGYSDGSSAASMFRYSGNSWKSTGFHSREGGPIKGFIDLKSLIIFSSNDIWIGGNRWIENPQNSDQLIDSSLIIHFNADGWHEHNIAGRGLLTIWGIDSNYIWFGGGNGTLFHKLENVMNKFPVSDRLTIRTLIGLNTDSVYIQSLIRENGIYHSLLEKYSQNKFTIIDSTQPFPADPKYGEFHLAMTKQGKIYTAGIGGIYERLDNGWKHVVNTNTAIINKIYICASNNIFGVGLGMIYHFNGENWQRYDSFSNPDIAWRDVWSDGSEVFIVGFSASASKTIVLHGK